MSAYQVDALDQARASDAELHQITVQRKEVQTNQANIGEWSEADLRFARPAVPTPQPPVQSEPAPTLPVVTPSLPSTGQVYVRGYYRKNGTYVHSYTRSR